MNTQDIADKIAENASISKTEARKLVDSVINTIADAVAAGEEVSINGFGKFSAKSTAARTGRNPRTGEPMPIAASRKPAFSAAKGLKDKVAG
jgi:DNA-binding protein HU-beta